MSSIPTTILRTSSSRFTRSAIRALHQDGRGPLPHDATPSTAPSPPIHPHPTSSTSSSLPPPSSSSSSSLPYVDVPSSYQQQQQHHHNRPTPPSLSHTHTAKSTITGRPLIIKEFTPKGKPVYSRPPIPSQIREKILSSTPDETGSPFESRKDGNVVHPLWKFFHVPRDGKVLGLDGGDVGGGAGMGSLDTLDSTGGDSEIMTSGRSWTAKELRTKSFTDLHTLWYLLLRERNVLATQREERRRLGVVGESEIITKRAYRCRKSMARIKYVLNERRLGLMAATESTRPSTGGDGGYVPLRSKVVGRSPLGGIDPLAVTGWESDIVDRMEAVAVSASSASSSASVSSSSSSSSVVEDGEVGKEEIESKDEGFGGGKEGEKFVDEMEKKGM